MKVLMLVENDFEDLDILSSIQIKGGRMGS